jgi:PucR C-terminal helix-turn-helix domain
VRVTAQGENVAAAEPVAAGWPRTEVAERAVLALERTGEPGPVDAMILERAAAAARAVLDRTRGRAPATDPAVVELIVDASAPSAVREVAARNLTGPVRAVALPTGPALLPEGAAIPPGRAGIGPAVPAADLPASYAAARIALRFAADGTEEDPGDTVVHYESLGSLALLAEAPARPEVPDLSALAHAIAAAPWALATLHAVAATASLRAAAARLRLHHSTLQDRVVHLEHLLGWPVREPAGKLRLQLALALRRLRRHPA